ncbi:sugar ABC transporter permease [Paenibacillus glycanilyticus]|uniref:carbohydrate ABC transporter permease n=1 Tax=Paenibacillus glycanilyticus TaxID=126569 RepID=UPI0020414398|nr:sugar ABC transporter permease [Paenibacillus glycanilyticus]MCM3630428.1 sugar ABC transporter permease [Paenibacillus glycanilyticus]
MKLNSRSRYVWAYFMIAPTLIGTLVFWGWPVVQSILLGFQHSSNFGTDNHWVGFDNYVKLVHDEEFWQNLRNTLIYVAMFVPVTLVLSTLFAVLLNTKIKGVSLYRVIFFLPQVTMPAAAAMVWVVLFAQDFGLINHLLGTRMAWLSNGHYAMLVLVIVGVWGAIGMNMLLILAGLQGIPRSLYEAADIDGAKRFNKFRFITIPMLTPTLFFTSIILFIGATQIFDSIYLIIGKTNVALPSVRSLVYAYYQNSFIYNDRNYGAAIINVLLVINLALTGIQFAFQKKWVHYD